jgi:glucokinase
VTRPVLAADVGGTHMRAALVSPVGDILLRRSEPTPGDSDVPAAFTNLVAAVASESRDAMASHAVVGLPGGVDYEAGRFLWAPNLPAQWPDQLSAAALSAQLGLPVSIANDADLAAVGEAWFGAGVGSSAVAFLTVSTGIGAGVVNSGRVVKGSRSLAEVGHVVIDWRAWRDGEPSTVEELGSGSGVARQAQEAGLGAVSSQAVEAAAAGGEPRAVAIWERAIAACAAGVSNLVMTFSPSTVIIGGGMGRQDAFFHPVRDMVLERPGHLPADLSILRSSLGDDAGLSGAAAWARATASA